MKHPYRNWIVILIIAFIVTAVGIFLIKALSGGIVKSAKKMPFSVRDSFTYTDDGVMYISGGTLCFLDFANAGKNNFTKALTMTNFKLAGSPSVKVIYNETSMQIVGANYPVEFSGIVLDVKCGDGTVAVLKRENQLDAILVFNDMGEQTDRFDFTDVSLISFGFYTSVAGQRLYTTTLDTDASLPLTTITTYDVERKATSGIMTVQSQLVSNIGFTEKSIFVTGTENLIRFREQTGTESYRQKVYGYEFYDASYKGKRPLFLFNQGNELNAVRLISLDEADIANEFITTVQLPDDVINVFLSNGWMYAVTPNSLLKYSASGEFLGEYAFSGTISMAYKLSNGYILVDDGASTTLLVLE